MTTPAVVLLCGGQASRFGADKTAADLGGTTVLDHILQELPQQWPVVCVGIPRPTVRPVRWTREDPPLGGPVAGIEAGLGRSAGDPVVVLAGDQPFSGRHAHLLVERLVMLPTVDAVVAEREGRPQYLLGAYRRGPLSRVTTGRPNTSVRSTLGILRVADLVLPPEETVDVDTPRDLERARAHLR